MARRRRTTSGFIFNLRAAEGAGLNINSDFDEHIQTCVTISMCDNQLQSQKLCLRTAWPYLTQCERALPSDCQKDEVSPFVILKMSATLEETSMEL